MTKKGQLNRTLLPLCCRKQRIKNNNITTSLQHNKMSGWKLERNLLNKIPKTPNTPLRIWTRNDNTKVLLQGALQIKKRNKIKIRKQKKNHIFITVAKVQQRTFDAERFFFFFCAFLVAQGWSTLLQHKSQNHYPIFDGIIAAIKSERFCLKN